MILSVEGKGVIYESGVSVMHVHGVCCSRGGVSGVRNIKQRSGGGSGSFCVGICILFILGISTIKTYRS